MKVFSITIALILSCNLHGQNESRKITLSNSELNYYDKYEVLKKDRMIKHGSFERYYFKILAESGQYDHNVKTGLWHYYDVDRKENLIYDYSGDKVISFKPDTALQTVIFEDRMLKAYVERPPLYKGSKLELLNYIIHTIHYPETAYDHWITGQVFVGIVIDENGKAVDYFIDRGIEKSLDEEAVRVISSFKGEWLPAIYNGQYVKSVYIQSITFKISWD
jgi:hypothetical protein